MRALRFEYGGQVRTGIDEGVRIRAIPGADIEPIQVLAAGGWDELDRRAVEEVPADDVRLLAPVRRPGKILCVGMNYRDHAREQGVDPPEHPVLFSKVPTAVIGPGDRIPLHPVTGQTDYEVELAVVIGRAVRGVSTEEALTAVAGYTCMNDVSARDLQFADGQWTRAKSLDGYAPIGPALVSPDEVGDPATLEVRAWVNGELRQESSTAELIFDVPTLIAFCAEAMTLEPGDLISTGTPAGVGVFMDPPRFLQTGDSVTVEVEHVGQLTNPVGEP